LAQTISVTPSDKAQRKAKQPECSETFSTKSHCNYRCDSLLSETVLWVLGLLAGRFGRVAQLRQAVDAIDK
jgi:hypothetical protein